MDFAIFAFASTTPRQRPKDYKVTLENLEVEAKLLFRKSELLIKELF